MLFTSLSFLTFFLPGVLVVSWALAWSARGTGSRAWRIVNAFLLFASLVFYFWGEGWGVLILLSSITANYLLGFALGCCAGERARRALLTLAVLANIGALAWFKYAAFGARCANTVFGLSLPLPEIALPLGISFYTFQAMSYVIDVYRRDVHVQRSPIDFACYISMFPQLVAGPIVRYSDIEASLSSRRIGLAKAASGMKRFLIGLARKVIIANIAADFADNAWSLVGKGLGLSPTYAWLALVCYTLQIYFDFSGYSDMAIGMGRMLGFDFPENFNFPYVSKTVREFWRRWHITLSSWFRDYIYIPLGGSRCSTFRASINGLVVFALCGLWHGASAMFLIWGLWHGLFITAERLTPWRLGESWFYSAIGRIRTLAVVMLGWVIFRSESLGEVWLFAKSLAGLAEVEPQTRTLAVDANPLLLITALTGIILATGAVARVRAFIRSRCTRRLAVAESVAEWCITTTAALFALMLIAGGSYNPFIYFRF